jgi:PTH1 family peptidyl-tRNA hydrolase
LAEIAKRLTVEKPKAKFDGELAEAQAGGERLLLLSPLTYMNHSGRCVQPTRDFYKIQNEDLLVICDDVALPTGKLRLRAKGSSGGQKGLKDILQRLGTEDIARLRVGINPPPPGWDLPDYVLSRYTKDEEPQIQDAIVRAADAALEWVRQGIAAAMNKYNAS